MISMHELSISVGLRLIVLVIEMENPSTASQNMS